MSARGSARASRARRTRASRVGRTAFLAIGSLALVVTAALAYWLRAGAADSENPLAAVNETRAPEPDRAASRRAIGPLVPEKLAPAAAGVDVRWAKLNRDAIAALDGGRPADAVEMLERCRAAIPGEPVFAHNLAEALARWSIELDDLGGDENREQALRHLERAAELAPQRDDIRKRLESVRRLADSEHGFFSEPSEHFVLSYDGERADLLWSSFEITKVLENAYQDFGELFGMWPVESGRPRIRVVLYKKQGFHEATGMGHWAAGLYDGSIRVPLEDLGAEKESLERVLRHEVAHAFVKESGGTSVPGWLNEGLAQWLELRDLVERAHAVERSRRRLEGRPWIPLEELQSSLGQNRSDEEVARVYAQALVDCDRIERSYGERVLFDMVAACRTSEGWREAFRRRTGLDIGQALAR